PLAEFAGNWIPGAGFVASGLKTVSSTNLSARRKTTAELRDEIENKMTHLKVNFIVVLDDLDRLEPAQAVEVLRLIRSVAD
ncbi:KAP family NTPase, partial [Escherichia coli]|nr:KAP family NTPase [Escherichia coli]